MSNQIRGTTTNMTKLVAWDIDLYQSMDTEENCLIWLSQQDKYLLGNALRQMKWATRWTSEQGTPQPDRDLIAENLAYKLSQEYCVDICQLIIDCINDPNSGVADSINNIIRPNTQNDSRDYGQSQSGTLLGDGNNTLCNLDVWYGGILNLVEQLNTNNEDALQVFEVVTNINELFANVVGSITGIDESSIDAVLQWITFIQQSIMENYVAQWTTTYRDAVVCDLFCMVKDTCELTPTMLYDYFLSRLNGQLQYESLLDQTLNFLVTGLWTGTEIVDAMMLSQIGFRAQLGKWFDFIGFNSIDVDIRLGFNDPSNDWQLLCTACTTTVIVTFDASGYQNYTIIDGTIDNLFGNPQPSILAVESPPGTGNERAWVRVDLTTTSETVTSANFDSYSSTGTYSAFIRFRDVNDVVLDTQTWTYRVQNQWNNVAWNGSIANVAYVEFFAVRTRAIVDIIHIDNLSVTFEAE